MMPFVNGLLFQRSVAEVQWAALRRSKVNVYRVGFKGKVNDIHFVVGVHVPEWMSGHVYA